MVGFVNRASRVEHASRMASEGAEFYQSLYDYKEEFYFWSAPYVIGCGQRDHLCQGASRRKWQAFGRV